MSHPTRTRSPPAVLSRLLDVKISNWTENFASYLYYCLTTSIIEQKCQPRPNHRSDGNSYWTQKVTNCELFPMSAISTSNILCLYFFVITRLLDLPWYVEVMYAELFGIYHYSWRFSWIWLLIRGGPKTAPRLGSAVPAGHRPRLFFKINNSSGGRVIKRTKVETFNPHICFPVFNLNFTIFSGKA